MCGAMCVHAMYDVAMVDLCMSNLCDGGNW